MSQQDAAIVGIYEYPDRDVDGELSPLQIKTLCAQKALSDAGLGWADVDGLFDASEGAAMSGLLLAEYWGLNPSLIDTTGVGGSSYEFHAAHALTAIRQGRCKVALLTKIHPCRLHPSWVRVVYSMTSICSQNNRTSGMS